jgi:hypothetical protein
MVGVRTNQGRTLQMTRRMLAVAVVVAASLLVPATASAKVLHFKGTAKADAQTEVTFDVKGFTKQVKLKNGKTRRRFVAKLVSNVHVVHQIVHCFKQSGAPADPPQDEFRATIEYAFHQIPPMRVKKNGRFSGIDQYEPPPETDPIRRNIFAGRFTGRRATGTFQAKYSPGGIQSGYCGNKTPEPWKASG